MVRQTSGCESLSQVATHEHQYDFKFAPPPQGFIAVVLFCCSSVMRLFEISGDRISLLARKRFRTQHSCSKGQPA
jgi:hypothetical protein